MPTRSHVNIGCSPQCELALVGVGVAYRHAVLSWHDGLILKDLGLGRTVVDSRVLAPGETVHVANFSANVMCGDVRVPLSHPAVTSLFLYRSELPVEHGGGVVLGRDPTRSHLVVSHRTVSRTHAKIDTVARTLTDLDSKDGTYDCTARRLIGGSPVAIDVHTGYSLGAVWIPAAVMLEMAVAAIPVHGAERECGPKATTETDAPTRFLSEPPPLIGVGPVGSLMVVPSMPMHREDSGGDHWAVVRSPSPPPVLGAPPQIRDVSVHTLAAVHSMPMSGEKSFFDDAVPLVNPPRAPHVEGVPPIPEVHSIPSQMAVPSMKMDAVATRVTALAPKSAAIATPSMLTATRRGGPEAAVGGAHADVVRRGGLVDGAAEGASIEEMARVIGVRGRVGFLRLAAVPLLLILIGWWMFRSSPSPPSHPDAATSWPVADVVSTASHHEAGAPAATAVPAARLAIACPTGMVSVPGRDDEGRRVDPFCIDRTEVTVDAYRRCVHCSPPSARGATCNWGIEGRGNHPVNCVDWNQAVAFCLERGARLPTDDEWTLAAVGTDGREFPWGDAAPYDQLCWSGVAERRGTCEVGAFPSGRSTVRADDMSGNLWEWTSTVDRDFRVYRGGGWRSYEPSRVRAESRFSDVPSYHNDYLGFRCALGAR